MIIEHKFKVEATLSPAPPPPHKLQGIGVISYVVQKKNSPLVINLTKH